MAEHWNIFHTAVLLEHICIEEPYSGVLKGFSKRKQTDDGQHTYNVTP